MKIWNRKIVLIDGIFRFAAALLSVLLAGSPGAVAIGLDTTFGTGGKVTATFTNTGTPSSFGNGVFIQQSGRIVIVGTHQEQSAQGRTNGIGLMALYASGGLDPTYGAGGRVVIWSASSNYNLFDRAMLGDGSVLILGQHFVSPILNNPILSKFTANGKPDTEFNANLDIFAGETNPLRMTLGSGGKIYVLVRRASGDEYFLVRLHPDGSRDPDFGSNGVRPISFARLPNRRIAGIHETNDGKVIVVGDANSEYSFDGRSFAARYNSDGYYDRTFGLQGIASIFGSFVQMVATRSILQPDGSTVGVGSNAFLGSHAMLVRFTSRGRPDPGFGTHGRVLTSFNDINVVYDVTRSDDGKIHVVGTCSFKAVPPFQKLFVARFSSSGARESYSLTDFFVGRDAGGQGIARQPDGKLVAVGFTRNQGDNLSQVAVARFDP